ncbi:hypothetical protein [Pseudonocardia aurantiaca]|uniref:Uncharacterized protein n=1 Tax=Pseudonocardia aurantiaca TaxID=75290 RepID=A0ABW4FP21_9PSEU
MGIPADLVAFISAEPGMAQRLYDDHRDDGSGHCRACTGGGQAGRYVWPCSLRRAAEVAAAGRRER